MMMIGQGQRQGKERQEEGQTKRNIIRMRKTREARGKEDDVQFLSPLTCAIALSIAHCPAAFFSVAALFPNSSIFLRNFGFNAAETVALSKAWVGR